MQSRDGNNVRTGLTGRTGTFYIRVNDDAGDLRSEIRVALKAGVNDDELSKTLCSDLATVGGAVAGAFSGGAALAAGKSSKPLGPLEGWLRNGTRL